MLIDDKEVWEGEVGRDALAVEGPVGIRSDNVRLDLELFAAPPMGRTSARRPAAPSRRNRAAGRTRVSASQSRDNVRDDRPANLG